MTGIAAKIRGRLPEQLESDVIRIKEYPNEVDQSSVERGNSKTNPIRKSSWGDQRLVASLIKAMFWPV